MKNFFKSFFRDLLLFESAHWMVIDEMEEQYDENQSLEKKIHSALSWIDQEKVPLFHIRRMFGDDVANEARKQSKRKFFCKMTYDYPNSWDIGKL